MGADYVDGHVVYDTNGETTAMDTRRASREFLKRGIDLLIFVGGDGTACDICSIVKRQIPMLGIPSGVKMYSGVFAITPKIGREIVTAFLDDDVEIVDREIMDIDEDAFRHDLLKIRLYGSVLCPSKKYFLQNHKQVFGEYESKEDLALFMSLVCRRGTFILGPGSTVAAIADRLGVDKTMLGVDVLENGKVAARDANEKTILKIIGKKKAKIIVSPLGGQGFIFGRGNHQISDRVIERVGPENVIIISTAQKMLHTPRLFVDTGDERLNKKFAGSKMVVTGFGVAIRKEVIS
jgi:predicted polyphosphate/ATP-dependent NAD kinase